jgi:hypothetical protein
MHQYSPLHAGDDSECASELGHLFRGRRRQRRNKPSYLEFNDLMYARRKMKVGRWSRHRELPEAGGGEIRGVPPSEMNRIPCTYLYVPFKRVHRKTPLGLGVLPAHTRNAIPHRLSEIGKLPAARVQVIILLLILYEPAGHRSHPQSISAVGNLITRLPKRANLLHVVPCKKRHRLSISPRKGKADPSGLTFGQSV